MIFGWVRSLWSESVPIENMVSFKHGNSENEIASSRPQLYCISLRSEEGCLKILCFDKKASKLSNAHSLMHFGPLVGYRHWFEVGKIFWIFGNFPLRTLELNWVSNFASLFSQQQFWVKSSTSDSTKNFSRRVIDMVWVFQMFS